MAVQPQDLQIIKAASQLGGAIGTEAAGGANELFGAVTGSQSSAGSTEYACAYLVNESSQTAISVTVYISSEDDHEGVSVDMGLGTSLIGGEEQEIADEFTAPLGVAFTETQPSGNAVLIGSMPAGSHKAIWLRMTVPPGTSAANFNYAITVLAETEA